MARKFKKKWNRIDSKRMEKCAERKLHRLNRKDRYKAYTVAQAKQFVTNLSCEKLSNEQICLLAKGQKFVPQNRINKVELLRDVDRLGRKMRIKYQFKDKQGDKLHPFWEKSELYAPPMANNAIEEFILALKIECSELDLTHSPRNLSERERQAISELNGKKDLVLRPADKGSNIVLLSRKQYNDECLRQLVGNIHYEEIAEPNTKDIHRQVLNIVVEMKEKGLLDEKTFKFLHNPLDKPKTPKFYTLPKIHKIKDHLVDIDPMDPTMNQDVRIPGRPIVAQCGGPTEKVGRFLDYFLVPIVKKEPMYLLDSKELLYILENEIFNRNVLLITYDVGSMYSNMPHDELLNSTRQALQQNANRKLTELVLPPIDYLIKLLEILLTRTEFEYDGRFFRQTIGASMGAVPSPEICDLRMFNLLKEILADFEYRDQILLHKKYRDDGLIIFDGTREEAAQLCTVANSAHPLLKFEFLISEERCTFLDLDLWKGDRFQESGRLDINTHRNRMFRIPAETLCPPYTMLQGFDQRRVGKIHQKLKQQYYFPSTG